MLKDGSWTRRENAAMRHCPPPLRPCDRHGPQARLLSKCTHDIRVVSWKCICGIFQIMKAEAETHFDKRSEVGVVEGASALK
jgi:hypothetical protein